MSGRSLGTRPAAGAAERSDACYRKVADHLIDRIESGTAPWTKAWRPGGKALPRNVATGKACRGGNSVWLASVAEMRGYRDERWGTCKQVQDLGGQVRRGQRGSSILFWQREARKLARDGSGRPVLDPEGQPVCETVPLDRPRSYPYTVFNAEQCSGLPRREPPEGGPAWDSIEAAEKVLKDSGAAIENNLQDRVHYDLGRDLIVMPYKEQFPNGPTCYQSALHELGHWTGHPERLNRQTLIQGIRDGASSPDCAREEPRAEIGSMMTGDRPRLGHDPSRSAAYVDYWIQALKDDPREICRASQDAQVMSDYVLDRGREKGPERGSGPATGRDRPRRPSVPTEENPPLRRTLFPREIRKGRAAGRDGYGPAGLRRSGHPQGLGMRGCPGDHRFEQVGRLDRFLLREVPPLAGILFDRMQPGRSLAVTRVNLDHLSLRRAHGEPAPLRPGPVQPGAGRRGLRARQVRDQVDAVQTRRPGQSGRDRRGRKDVERGHGAAVGQSRAGPCDASCRMTLPIPPSRTRTMAAYARRPSSRMRATSSRARSGAWSGLWGALQARCRKNGRARRRAMHSTASSVNWSVRYPRAGTRRALSQSIAM